MRQILVDHARRHRAAKRGHGETMISLDDAPAALGSRSVDLLALDEASAAGGGRRAQGPGDRVEVLRRARDGGDRRRPRISLKTVEKDVRLASLAALRAERRAAGMNPERFRQLEALYDAAAALDPAERALHRRAVRRRRRYAA